MIRFIEAIDPGFACRIPLGYEAGCPCGVVYICNGIRCVWVVPGTWE
jgi:hypothetical protein